MGVDKLLKETLLEYKVIIHDTRDNQEHIFFGTWDLNYESLRYMWTEGNYSCDCNRALFINAKGCPCNAGANLLKVKAFFILKGGMYESVGGKWNT